MRAGTATRGIAGLVLLGALAAPAGAGIITVDSNADTAADDGVCTLREAITSANENTRSGVVPGECEAGDPVYPGQPSDVIRFRIPGSGPFVFDLGTPLPFVRERTFIDGYTQPGARLNTAPVGSNAVIQLEVRGDLMADGCLRDSDSPLQSAAFQFVGGDASASRLRGFAVTGFTMQQAAVFIFRAAAVQIDGNFIGFDTSGRSRPNGLFGVWVVNGSYRHIVPRREDELVVDGSPGNLIGGHTPEERNVIAGSDTALVVAGQRNRVEGNYLGVDPQGLVPELGRLTVLTGELGLSNCMETEGFKFVSSDNTFGGWRPEHGNLIVPGTTCGVQLGSDRHRVQSNLIGTDRNGGAGGGSGLGGNRGCGVLLPAGAMNNEISTNAIAFNTTGVAVKSVAVTSGALASMGNDIRANSIFSNSRLGIDLEDDGVTANDGDDADAGSNGLQNFPEKLFATTVGVRGELRGKPDQLQRLDVFQNTACDSSGNGEGAEYVGSTHVFTDASGFATFSFNALHGLTVERFVTATATSSDGTSEFSQCAVVVAASAAQVRVSSTPNPARSHERYTITVSVRGTDGIAPLGLVRLRDAGTPQPLLGGGTVFFEIGSEFLTPVAGTDESRAVIDSSRIQLPGRGWGNVRILADYDGDSRYAAVRAQEFVQGIYREKSDFDNDGLTDLLLCDAMGKKYLVPGRGATGLVPVPQLDTRTVLGTGEFGPAGNFGVLSFPGVLWRAANGRHGGTLFGANAPWGDFDLRLPRVASPTDPNHRPEMQLEALGSMWGTTSDDFIAVAESQQYVLLQREFLGAQLVLYPPWKTGRPTGDHLVEHVGDFDGDGNLDWHFRSPTSEPHVLWRLDGRMRMIGENYLAYQPPGGTVAATGDFDADGRADHVWRRMDGSFEIVLQDGVTTRGQLVLTLAAGDAVVGTALLDDSTGSSRGRSSLIVSLATGQLEAWINTGVNGMGLPVFGTVRPVPTSRTDLTMCVP